MYQRDKYLIFYSMNFFLLLYILPWKTELTMDLDYQENGPSQPKGGDVNKQILGSQGIL